MQNIWPNMKSCNFAEIVYDFNLMHIFVLLILIVYFKQIQSIETCFVLFFNLIFFHKSHLQAVLKSLHRLCNVLCLSLQTVPFW